MAKVVFYEKPGCGGNARQRALLVRSGHQLDVRDLLATQWTAGLLRSFFGSRPVAEWFNSASPRVKSGDVVPAALDADTAIALMLADSLLIRRPLIEADGRREVGFDTALIGAWIGLEPSATPITEGCPQRQHGHAADCAAAGSRGCAAGDGQPRAET